MLNVQITDFAAACLRADVSSNQTQIFVSTTENFPTANGGTNNCFYIKVIRKSDGAVETMRVTLTQGQAWSLDRAVGLNEVPLDFCMGDDVQTGVLAPAVNNINMATIRFTDIGSLPTEMVSEGRRAMDTTVDTAWVEYEWMNGGWRLTGRTYNSNTNAFV